MSKNNLSSFLANDGFVVASDVCVVGRHDGGVDWDSAFLWSDSADELNISAELAIQLYNEFLGKVFSYKSFQRTTLSFRLPTFEWWRSPLSKSKYLSDVSPKDKPWDLHRAASDLVATLYDSADFEKYAERIESCSKLLEFEKAIKDNKFIYKLRSAHFCRHRHCIICQWRRTLMWMARFLKAMPKIQEDYPKHRYIFLTLTVKNCSLEELRSTITWMNKSFIRLSQRKAFPANGYIKSLEVTRNKDDNTAHPHFHILLMVPCGYFSTRGGYLSKDKWIKLWRSCLRVDYDPSIDIKAINHKANEQGLVGALREVFKYQVKPGDLVYDKAWLIELTKQMHKTRSIGLGGVFKKYLSEHEPEDYITEDSDADNELLTDERFLANWKRDIKRYVVEESAE